MPKSMGAILSGWRHLAETRWGRGGGGAGGGGRMGGTAILKARLG